MQTNKKNKMPRNEKGRAHGYWEVYHLNGQLWIKGTYFNGIRHGYWEEYINDGRLYLKGNFVNGERVGLWIEDGKKYFYAN